MPSKTYICIDTNVMVACAFADAASLTPRYLDVVFKTMEESGSVLLMPEIIYDELDCVISSRCEKLKEEINRVIGELEKTTLGPKVKDRLGGQLKQGVKDVAKDACETREKINGRIEDPSFCEKIEIADEDIRHGIKIAASHRKPAKNKHSNGLLQADCLIIAALKRFSELHPDDQIILCSNNTADFAVAIEGKKDEYDLHPDIKSAIPRLMYFNHPKKMLEAIQKLSHEESEELDLYDVGYEREALVTLLPTVPAITTPSIPNIDSIIKPYGNLAKEFASSMPRFDYSSVINPVVADYGRMLANAIPHIEYPDYSAFVSPALADYSAKLAEAGVRLALPTDLHVKLKGTADLIKQFYDNPSDESHDDSGQSSNIEERGDDAE